MTMLPDYTIQQYKYMILQSIFQGFQMLIINFFAVSIISLALPASSSVDNRYETCSSALFSCANYSNVGYPFWGGGRPKYCGHPSLELQCLDSDIKPQVQLIVHQGTDVTYHVDSMKLNDLNITLELRGYENISCSNISKEYGELFNITSNDESITLIYNCTKDISMPNLHESVPCFGFPYKYEAYYVHNMSAIKEYASCSSFEFPVLKDQLDLYNQQKIRAFLDQGFEVNYEYSSECINCNSREGICGSSDNMEFACFYKNGTDEDGYIRKSNLKLKIGIAGGVFILLALSIGLCCYLKLETGSKLQAALSCLRKERSSKKFSIFWKSKATKCPNVNAFLEIYGSLALTSHTYSNIRKMTNGFKDKLGEGGYAIVYKGKLLNGRLVAVKVLKQSKGNGEDFLNEVASISRTNHVNIVSLLGFCFEGNKRALIYEYMPNGSLEKFTFHGASANQALPWDTLFNIAIGIARGLDYLHRGCNARILHFDIKPHNILLDEKFCPKISDFGLARLCPLQESTISTMEARGTIGYIAPEVFCRTIGGVSHKSDVYSFGMMVLDMVCGRQNLSTNMQRSSDNVYFPQWIYDRLELENESGLEGPSNDEEKAVQRKMILVSLWCIQTYPTDRPSMSRVVDMLQGCLESIDIPPKRNLYSPPRLALDTSGTFIEIND